MPLTNYIPSSRVIQPGVCTSTTRPASPYEGQCIFETDTDRLYVWNGSAWVIPNQNTQNPVGMELIVTRSFGGATGINIDGCFTSAYRNYHIVADYTTPSSTTVIYELRASGTTNTGANVQSLQEYMVWGSTSYYANQLTNQTYSYFGYSNADGGGTTMNLYGPSLAKYTYASSDNPLADYRSTSWAKHSVNTQYDGIRISSFGGTAAITGSVSVYGIRG
jgi:hypothetical protein